jgi:hypothetical protein
VSKLFGANWQTSLWGFITLVAGAISLNPHLTDFLPDSINGYVKGLAGVIAFISGGAFALKVKDKNVTGGSVQQTVAGNLAEPGTQTLVDQTVKASIASGEQVTPEQKQAAQS